MNKVYNMDCFDGMKHIPDKSFEMILCDLPYGTTQNKWDSVIPLDALWMEYNRIIKDNGVIVLTAQTPFDKVLGCSNLKMLKYEWIWMKETGTGFLNAKKMPMKQHENILVFYKRLPTYNPQMTQGTPYKTGFAGGRSSNYGKFQTFDGAISTTDKRYPKTVLSFPRDGNRIFPTQKPVALFEYLIKTYTNPYDSVLDNCIGSGTTAIACLNTNRNFLGFEKDEQTFNLCINRINEHKNAL
jgi:site-specific DNA-methyltransferase (adenine-specific)